MSKCEICGKEGFHKMSCSTQKVVVFISDENPKQKEIRKRLIDRAIELQNECEEYMQKIREKLNGDNS
jgi:guanylate kinase